LGFRYFRDEKSRTLYRTPEQPTMHPKTQGRGNKANIIGWTASMQIDNVRADNRLDGHRWLHPTFEIRQMFYPLLQHSQDDALHYFLLANLPDGEEISSEEYGRLAKQYQPEG